MNREILFRGFHKEENGKETIYIDGQVVKGTWLYGSLLHLAIGYRDLYYIVPKNTCYNEIDFCKDTINAIWEEQDFIEVIPETIGRYTGLEDKNGKKIFEDDVLKRQLYQDGRPYGTHTKKVEFRKNARKCGFNISKRISNNYAIIGNKWSNDNYES